MAELCEKGVLPETTIESQWGMHCDELAPPTSVTFLDSTDRSLPDESFLLKDLFSETECRALIRAAESAAHFGFTNYQKEYRGNLRLTTMDSSLADIAWSRIKKFVPETVTFEGVEWIAIGLNECWRLAKYFPGDKFARHFDSSFERNPDETSFYTVNAYMNSDFTGGATRFFDELRSGTEVASVQGTVGSCLIFRQPPGALIAHDGEEVTGGLKYLFRTDVLYRRVGAPLPRISQSGSPEESDSTTGLGLLHEAECFEAAGRYQEAIATYMRVRREYPKIAREAGIV